MPGDPNFTSGAIIAYNGDSERGWNDPPTLSFNSTKTNSNRRGKLDLRKRIAHDQAISGTGPVVPPSAFPPKGINNDLCKGVANLGITSVANNGYIPVQAPPQPGSFYNPGQQVSTHTTPSLPAYPISSIQTDHVHAASMSTLPQEPHYYNTLSSSANSLNIAPHHAGFHRSVSEPNFAHPHVTHPHVRQNSNDKAELSTSPPGVRSTADLVTDDHTASHIGQPLVKTYNPLMITPLVPVPSRQFTPPVAQPVTTQPANTADITTTPFNSPQIAPSLTYDPGHDPARRSSSPGMQSYLLNGGPCRSGSTSPAPPAPLGTPPLSRSEGSSPRSSSPKTNEELVDDGKTEEERRNSTMEILLQVLETRRDGLKKAADEISKKMELMNQKWKGGKLSETAQRRLFKLATALQQHNYDEADKVHLSIIVDHVSEVNQFMVAIKKLIAVSKSAYSGAVL